MCTWKCVGVFGSFRDIILVLESWTIQLFPSCGWILIKGIMWWRHWGISSASNGLRCLYLLHSGSIKNKAEPIRICIPFPVGISECVLFCVSARPTEQVSLPQKSGLNPVHLCSYEAKEFLFSLILLTVFNPLLNNSSFSLLFPFFTNTPSSFYFSPTHPVLYPVSVFLFFLQLSLFSSLFPGNSLCSAAQVWQWGVCGGWTPRTLWLLWWVALGRWSLFPSQFGTTHKKLLVKTITGL